MYERFLGLPGAVVLVVLWLVGAVLLGAMRAGALPLRVVAGVGVGGAALRAARIKWLPVHPKFRAPSPDSRPPARQSCGEHQVIMVALSPMRIAIVGGA